MTDAQIQKTDAEWKKELTPEQYRVLREKATEAPFTGQYDQHFETGMYVCAACGQKLFASENKFDAGCGWPSYDRPAADAVVKKVEDLTHGIARTEVLCSRCGGHLGHVFDDGPTDTTGKRYCINSVALGFQSKKKS